MILLAMMLEMMILIAFVLLSTCSIIILATKNKPSYYSQEYYISSDGDVYHYD